MDKLPTEIIDIIVEYSTTECFKCKKTNMRKLFRIFDQEYCSRCIRKLVIDLEYELNYDYLKNDIENNLSEANMIMKNDVFHLTLDMLGELYEETEKDIKIYIMRNSYSKTTASPIQMFNILFKQTGINK